MFGGIGKAFGGITKAVVSIAKPIVNNPIARMIPGVGTALGIAGGALSVYDALQPKSPSMPSLPIPTTGGINPNLSMAMPMNFDRNPGILPRGPGGSLALPFNNPNAGSLAPWSLDDQYLRTYYRAPKGYVVLRDQDGKPFPVEKRIARELGYWKPNKKPPISVSDWQALKKSSRTIKKLKRVTKMAQSVANYTTVKRVACATKGKK